MRRRPLRSTRTYTLLPDTTLFRSADQFVLLPTQCVPVGEAPAPFDAGEAASPLAVADRLHRADQGLRRHTAYIDAGPSDDAMADEGDLGARFRRRDGGREPGGTGTNHREIVSLPRGTIGAQCRRHDICSEVISWRRRRYRA